MRAVGRVAAISAKLPFLGLLLAFAGACASDGRMAPCTEESLLDSWKAEWVFAVWTFEPEGALACQGICDYGPRFGEPLSWAPDPTANLWASGLDYVKISFDKVVLEGTTGALRCRTDEFGRRLILEPFDGPDLTFVRLNEPPE